MAWHTKFTPYVIFSVGVFMHVFFLGGVMDTYFTSPLEHNLQSVRSEAEPLAKRVVLFISDGLRAEGLLKHADVTPYLTSIRANIGVWGVGHTQVPTESRPGHIGILGGIYEDPSAIFKGWQANTVEFDSVVKQAKNTFSWGCPDIVNIFEGPNVTIQAYDDPELRDFSGKKAPRALDEWVFNQVRKNLTNRDGEECGRYCEDGNIFFLHLLGMDTVGHVFKPDSVEYLDTLKAVSTGVQEMVMLFQKFFKDDKTAYIFTSDHGMTNRGSHGSGSTHETEIPVIGWGSGFRQNSSRQDINQTDLAPLISCLLSINIPTNSIGRLPLKYLNGTREQLAGALLANVQQITVQFIRKHNDSVNSFFHVPFGGISYLDFVTIIGNLQNDYYDNKLYDRVFEFGYWLIDVGLQGIRYYQYFYQIPTLIYLTIIFLTWFAFILIFISTSQQRPNRSNRFSIYRNELPKLYCIIAIMIIMMCWSGVHYKYYIYAAVGIGLFILLIQLLLQNTSNIKFPLKIWQAALMFLYIEILVLSFFYRECLAIALLIIFIWGCITFQNVAKWMYVFWAFSIGYLTIFLFLEISDKFSYPLFVMTVTTFPLVVVFNMGVRRLPFTLYLYMASCANTLVIAHSFDNGDGVPLMCLVFSYAIACSALVTIWSSHTYLMQRLGAIVMALMCIYIHMTIYFEGLFYGAIVTLMYTWLQLELLHGTHIIPPARTWNELHGYRYEFLPRMQKTVEFDDFRRVLFFLTFILACFFGTGNIASISSFNPMAARAFTSDFVPHLIMFILILKICIPFIICTCTFILILKIEKSNITRLFAIIMLFCDIMVLNFMFMVKNEGSWQEIGMSLSHFVIAEAMTLVLCLLFYACLFLLKPYNKTVSHVIKAKYFKTQEIKAAWNTGKKYFKAKKNKSEHQT